MPTITVIGNCQAQGIGACLRAMSSTSDVRHVSVRREAELVKLLEGSEIVFVQTPFFEMVRTHRSIGSAKIVLIPAIHFPAFHPDAIQVRDSGALIASPVGNLHSSLVLYAWKNGIPARELTSLFCAEVFRHLGFFSYMDAARHRFRQIGEECGIPIHDWIDRYLQDGCFMHLPNHPKIHVLADVAAAALGKVGLDAKRSAAGSLRDNLQGMSIWPIYPEIAAQFGWTGNYRFQSAHSRANPRKPPAILDFDEFVEKSFEIYDRCDPDKLTSPRLASPMYIDLKRFIGNQSYSGRGHSGNPYANLPDHQFWRRGVERVSCVEVDPVVRAPFVISPTDKIATAGSCFAQHIARTLKAAGYNYFVTEQAPEGMSPEEAAANAYGLFSARFGNIYTARQMVQLVDRAYGRFAPVDRAWPTPTGEFVDPFRPQVAQKGYTNVESVTEARAPHFAAVRAMLEGMDIFIFTLGLTESWRCSTDGAVFPLAPGVVAGSYDNAHYEFVNFSIDEVRADLDALLSRLSEINPRARVILTVSPVPLVATYEDRHVLVSTTYSKAVLLVAAAYAAEKYANVAYFPSYEIITGNFNRGAYYDGDLRSVREAGVAHVMRLFMRHYSGRPDAAGGSSSNARSIDAILDEMEQVSRVVCDEEKLDS